MDDMTHDEEMCPHGVHVDNECPACDGKHEPKAKTHAVTKPNLPPPTPIEVLKQDMAGGYLKQIENYFGGNRDEALRFMTSAVDYVRRSPKLLDTDRQSLLLALVQVAQYKFLPSGVSGEAYIIPYAREAKFQMGYQGYLTLIYRTKKVSGIRANIIHEADVFEYEEGIEPKLVHKPALFGKKRGKPIGVYAVADMVGGARIFKVMDEEAVMAIKNLSKAKGSKESPWNSDKDPELWMWKKTCLLQLIKVLPKTPELVTAVESDYEGEGANLPRLDAAGPAVGKASHSLAKAPEEAEMGDGQA
jgi:recombination protein RecT